MRVLKRPQWLASLGALLVAALSAGTVSADISTDRGGSIIAFPKVISDGTRDTLIQISNLNNRITFAHCMYLDASPEIPGLPVGPNNPRRCQERDFVIRLTRQQPTFWRVSTGRLLNNFDGLTGECEIVNQLGADRQNCPGFDPGNVINVGTTFEGHLVCVETDSSGAPIGGDGLKGEALIENVATGGADGIISMYNALSISQGIDGPDGNEVLELNGIEYAQCPEQLRFTHLAEGVQDPAAEAIGVVPALASTDLTLMPCTINYESQARPRTTLQFLVWDDQELQQSLSTTLDCWFDSPLSAISATAWLPTRSTTYQTAIRPATGFRCRFGPPELEYGFCTSDDDCGPGGQCLPSSGVLGVAETVRVLDDGSEAGASAINLHVVGTRLTDTIVLQTGQQGSCVGGINDGNPCTGNAECPGGSCD